MPSCPRNYPFTIGPKPIGIIILLFFSCRFFRWAGILREQYRDDERLGYYFRAYSVCQFVTSIGMAAFAPFLYELVCIRREKLMCIAGFALMYVFSYVCAKTDSIFAGTLQPADRVPAYGTDDGQSVYADQICFWHGGNA